jgi:hypothetical protein
MTFIKDDDITNVQRIMGNGILIVPAHEFERPSHLYTGHKISPSLSFVTERVEEMERASEEQDVMGYCRGLHGLKF